MENLKRKKGFTLIELIIVIAILGILAAIAVPRYGNIQADSKRKADFANAKVIADATLIAITNNVAFADAAAPTSAEIATYLPQYPKPQLVNGVFSIAVASGQVTVSVVADGAQTIGDTSVTDNDSFQLYPVLATKEAPYN